MAQRVPIEVGASIPLTKSIRHLLLPGARPATYPLAQNFLDAMLAKIDLNLMAIAKDRAIAALVSKRQKFGKLHI